MERKFKVITLCGSSKFKKEFIEIAEKLSLEGNIVISLGLFGHADNKFGDVITPEIKEMLDAAHRQKIKMSDAIYVINPGGYIGMSTRREIHYARELQKEIIFMEEPTFKFKGVYHTYGNLMRALSDRMIEPDGGDVYFIFSNILYGEKEAVDIYGEPILPHTFVAYNPDMCGFYLIDLNDAKITLKDPYPYLGDKTGNNHIIRHVVPDDIYRSKSELDERFDTSTATEEPKDYSLSTEIFKKSAEVIQEEIDSEVNSYINNEKSSKTVADDLSGTFITFKDLLDHFPSSYFPYSRPSVGDKYKILEGGMTDDYGNAIESGDIVEFVESHNCYKWIKVKNEAIGLNSISDIEDTNKKDVISEEINNILETDNEGFCGTFETYENLVQTFINPIMGDKLRIGDRFKIVLGGGADMLNQSVIDNDIIVYRELGNGIIGFAREKNVESKDKSDNIPDILREDLETRISEVSCIPSSADNEPSPYPRTTLISKLKLRGTFETFNDLLISVSDSGKVIKHKELFQVNDLEGTEDMYGTKLSNGDIIAAIFKSSGGVGWMKIASKDEAYVSGQFEKFKDLVQLFTIGFYNKLPRIGDRFEILTGGGYDIDKNPIEAGDIVEYQLGDDSSRVRHVWRKVVPKIIDLDTI